FGCLGRLTAGVDAHVAEAAAEARLHSRAHVSRERRAGALGNAGLTARAAGRAPRLQAALDLGIGGGTLFVHRVHARGPDLARLQRAKHPWWLGFRGLRWGGAGPSARVVAHP